MCLACDLIVNVGISELNYLKLKVKVTNFFMIRFTLLIIFTLNLIYFRLFIMNFENPKFKAMDNPVAAADIITRVRTFLFANSKHYN